MKKKVIWLVLSGGTVLTLLLSACAPAVVEEAKVVPKEEVVTPREEVVPKEVVVPKEAANMVKWTGKKLDGTVVEKMLEKPKYGGTLVTVGPVEPTIWDEITRHGGLFWQGMPVHEPLFLHDWTRGPFGTGEWSALYNIIREPGTVEAGVLAESWELLDEETLVFHIRQGVRWGLDPTREASRLVAGRELTAADIVQSTVRNWSKGYPVRNYPYLSDMKNPANSIYLSPDDPWAVVIKTKPGEAGLLWRHATGARNKIYAPEVTGKYGEIIDWRQVVGTGPFFLKDYTTASSLTYERNPNYWMHDPFFPENQLPYIDGIKYLIIPDLSTQMAALRTGKIDNLPGTGGDTLPISLETAQTLWKTNPELQWLSYLGEGGTIYMRNDTKPLDDVRVRQALSMAINFQELADGLYDGEAELFTYPVFPIADYIESGMYIPLEKLPQSVQELYGYHPDRARQLLAEAGYPAGFKTEIILTPADVDLMSVIKNYWAQIGVDVELQVRDHTAWEAIGRNFQHKQMYFTSGGVSNMIWASTQRKGGGQNYSIIDEPWHLVQYEKLIRNYFNARQTVSVYTEPMAEGMPSWIVYTNEQTWYINLPMQYEYLFWQPWLKMYAGTRTGTHYTFSWPKHVWIDRELKKAMGR